MSGFYQKLLAYHGTRKVVGHTLKCRGGLYNSGNSGLSKKIVKHPLMTAGISKRYGSNYAWNRYCQGLSFKHYKRYNSSNHVESSRWIALPKKDNLMVPIIMGSATIKGSSKECDSKSNHIADWLEMMKTYLKNSVTLYADSNDGIPDINALTKDISEHGVKKIEEAQKLLQQKLKKMRADAKKTHNDLEKEALKLSIDAIEEAIYQLEVIKRNIKKELKKKRK